MAARISRTNNTCILHEWRRYPESNGTYIIKLNEESLLTSHKTQYLTFKVFDKLEVVFFFTNEALIVVARSLPGVFCLCWFVC